MPFSISPGVKFSQFLNGLNPQLGDQFVGLRSGTNYRFDGSPTGTTGQLSREISQTAHGFTVQQIVRFNGTLYVLAQGDSAADADVLGMVSAVDDVNDFELTLYGYVPGLSGLTPGADYFLDPTVAGGMTLTAPSTPGQVRKALFTADSATSGYFYNNGGQQL